MHCSMMFLKAKIWSKISSKSHLFLSQLLVNCYINSAKKNPAETFGWDWEQCDAKPVVLVLEAAFLVVLDYLALVPVLRYYVFFPDLPCWGGEVHFQHFSLDSTNTGIVSTLHGFEESLTSVLYVLSLDSPSGLMSGSTSDSSARAAKRFLSAKETPFGGVWTIEFDNIKMFPLFLLLDHIPEFHLMVVVPR